MLIGALQGIIFAIIIFFSKKYRNKANFFLAFLVLCIAVNNLQYYLLDIKLINAAQFFGIVYIPFPTLSMVMYFFYVQFFLYPNSQFSFKYKLLLLPFMIFFLLTVFYKVALAFDVITIGINQFFENLVYIHEIVALLYSFALLIGILTMVFNFEKKNKCSKKRINWLKYTSWISFSLCFLWAFSIARELSGFQNSFYLFWIVQSFTIYWLGHLGIYEFGIQEEQQSIREFAHTQKIVVTIPSKNEHIFALENYIVNEKNYLNSELTLDLVAEKLDLSKSYLSRIINAELKMSFTDYINSLRVEEVKRYIQNPEFEKYTLIAIGLEAGFNSKSVFNNSFKKFTGFTPSEYKKSILKEKPLNFQGS